MRAVTDEKPYGGFVSVRKGEHVRVLVNAGWSAGSRWIDVFFASQAGVCDARGFMTVQENGVFPFGFGRTSRVLGKPAATLFAKVEQRLEKERAKAR